MSPQSIAPGLLLALPQLRDPNFERSVVLMLEHHEDGAFGLIVNHPTEMRLSELLDGAGIAVDSLARDATIWTGGPVMPGDHEPLGLILYRPKGATIPGTSDDSGDGHVTTDLALYPLPADLSILDALLSEPPDRVRFLLGYSGWGPGQLERELAAGAWLVGEASADLVFETPCEDMWDSAVRELGIDPAALANLVPGTGELN
jgi:putative transcriptional regulator